ncbi:hypothetical protein [Nitratireductor luteus]|uniref:hypothetical protein n=1 Tax=Nitratireductor luteus TaxID=2976980 RepID=UPI0022403F23|nr:hypothetical protein [Nitratireductor luteus]
MKPLVVTACLLLSSAAASASSADAWEEFRADVETKCIAAVPDNITEATAWVHDTGTESFGVAVVSGKSSPDGARYSYFCVYDKQSGGVELTPQVEANELMDSL